MRLSRTTEILVGLFMLAGLVALFFLAMKVSNLTELTGDDGYSDRGEGEEVHGADH